MNAGKEPDFRIASAAATLVNQIKNEAALQEGRDALAARGLSDPGFQRNLEKSRWAGCVPIPFFGFRDAYYEDECDKIAQEGWSVFDGSLDALILSSNAAELLRLQGAFAKLGYACDVTPPNPNAEEGFPTEGALSLSRPVNLDGLKKYKTSDYGPQPNVPFASVRDCAEAVRAQIRALEKDLQEVTGLHVLSTLRGGEPVKRTDVLDEATARKVLEALSKTVGFDLHYHTLYASAGRGGKTLHIVNGWATGGYDFSAASAALDGAKKETGVEILVNQAGLYIATDKSVAEVNKALALVTERLAPSRAALAPTAQTTDPAPK